MSPALKSKAKTSPKMVKEQQKVTSPPRISNGGSALATSTSNSVALHVMETTQPAPSQNGRLLNMADLEEQNCVFVGNKSECDLISNNGSCSGESEDQKEKTPASTSLPSEAILGGDADKRDKIRQKNERKHQRQKERRAQELQERCTTILMSRKLDLLTQQLVGMGFPVERATRALILNEGRVEASVSWLFEGEQEEEQPNETKKDAATNMKIDISDELAKITEMEAKLKCSKQDIQRVVVSCDGDMEKAMEILWLQQKQAAPSTPMAIQAGSAPVVNGLNQTQLSQVVTKKPNGVATQQLRREEKTAIGGPGLLDPRIVAFQTSLKANSRSDWVKNQQSEKKWGSTTSGQFVLSFAPSSLQAVTPPKIETRNTAIGGEGNRLGLQSGSIREPIVVMQRPLSTNIKQHQPSTSASLSMPSPAGWDSNRLPLTDAAKISNSGLSQRYINVNQSTGSLLNPNSQPFLQPDRSRHSFMSSSSEVDAMGWGVGLRGGNGKPSGQPLQLANHSSLGIFTGWGSSSGSSGSSSPVDWSNGGLIPQLDYTRVDWSLDSTPLGLEIMHGPSLNDYYEPCWNPEAPLVRNPRLFQHSSRVAMIQDNSSFLSVDPISAVLSPDWTSPFAGNDIFRVPRQIATSPTL